MVCTNATLYILIFPSFTTLPLDIISFSAKVTNANTKLEWISENQINVNRFEIERSPANPVSFTTIGTVAVNNSSTGNYAFTDINAKSFISKGYYRLKIIDNDERFTFSQIALVNFGKDFAISIRPTVITAGQSVSILTGAASNGKSYTGLLYNQAGQVLQTWNSLTGSLKQIETDQLSKGVYIVKIIYEKEVKIEKLIVQ